MNVSPPQDDSVGYIAEIGVYVYTDIHICTHVLSHSIYCRECNILYIHVHICTYHILNMQALGCLQIMRGDCRVYLFKRTGMGHKKQAYKDCYSFTELTLIGCHVNGVASAAQIKKAPGIQIRLTALQIVRMMHACSEGITKDATFPGKGPPNKTPGHE